MEIKILGSKCWQLLLYFLCSTSLFYLSEVHPFITASLVAPCPIRCVASVYLFVSFACPPTISTHLLLILFTQGLLWAIQCCNHQPCLSTIFSFLFSHDSLSLSLPKGSPESPNPLFSCLLCLSTHPSMHPFSLAPCVFLQSGKTQTNHSVSTLSPILPLYKSVPPPSLILSFCLEHLRWEKSSHHCSSTSLGLLPSLHHFQITPYTVSCVCARVYVRVCVCVYRTVRQM